MGAVQKTLIIMIMANLFLYFFLPSEFIGPDTTEVLGNFINLEGDTASVENTTFSRNLPSDLETDDAIVGSSTLSIASPFRMIWDSIEFILTLFFGPVVLAYIIPDIPIEVAAIIIIPNMIILIMGTISFIRGADW